MRVDAQSSEGVPYETQRTHGDAEGRPSEDEADVELMRLQSQAHQGLPAAPEVRTGPNRFSLRASRGSQTCPHFRAAFLASRMVTE